jgi:hypothetical protein
MAELTGQLTLFDVDTQPESRSVTAPVTASVGFR